jgi:phosphoribosyl 1,2-cyclic phosphate phosphodiesterase
MKSKLIILGCGSSVGVPRIDGYWGKCKKKNKKNNRTRCSAIVIKGSNSILIDTSPDLKFQLLNNKIKNISSVIITHEHADQTNGLFELRPFFWKNKKKIDIYGNLKTINHLKKRHDYLFKKISDYPPILKSIVIKKKFSIGKRNDKIYFQTINVTHGKTTSLVYIFEKIAYVSDCNDLSIIKAKVLKNLNYLIIDCLKFKNHPSHFNLEQALFVHYKLKPKKTILTNLHHDIDYNFLKSKLPRNVLPAFDNLQIKF